MESCECETLVACCMARPWRRSFSASTTEQSGDMVARQGDCCALWLDMGRRKLEEGTAQRKRVHMGLLVVWIFVANHGKGKVCRGVEVMARESVLPRGIAQQGPMDSGSM